MSVLPPVLTSANLPTGAADTTANQPSTIATIRVPNTPPPCAQGFVVGNKLEKIIAMTLFFSLAAAGRVAADNSTSLPRSAPEAQGISSAAILDFVTSADRQVDAMNSFMLVRHGHVVAEGWWSPYAANIPHSMYSLSKSFTSTAVGLAISDGKLSLDDEVLKFFPDEAPAAPSENLKAMRVRDLLTMSTGQLMEDVTNGFSFDATNPLVKLFLSVPVAHKPGTYFWYNTPATFMESAIVQTVTGQTVFDYLKPRLFDPLGIENPTWEMRQQYTYGGSGLHLRTEDIARFGQLLLQRGNWHGHQLVPAAWIETATARQTSNGSNPESDWEQGYGFNFWRCRHGLFRGDGAFGQFCIVMPEQDAVVAITSGTRDMQGVMNLVWDKILPALQSKPLDADEDSDKRLTDTLQGLTLHPQPGSAAPGVAAKWSGKTFLLSANNQKLESVALEFGGANDPVTLVLRGNGRDQRIACGKDSWLKGRMAYASFEEQPVAASGAWTADGTYTVKLSFYETPFRLTLALKFTDDKLFYDCEYNVNFGPTTQPQLIGIPQ
jgi:CubicO group peptidase (beta-lactamase class C family)